MADVEKFKEKIRNVVSQDYRLEFLGDNFEKTVNLLSETKVRKIYEWIGNIINGSIHPLSVGSKKKYKDWNIYELLFFKKDMNIESVSYRIFFIKVKNLCYIEFHLGKHEYYDKLRKQLDLTKKNY